MEALSERISDCLLDLGELQEFDVLNEQSRASIVAMSQDGLGYLAAAEVATKRGVSLPEAVIKAMEFWCEFVESLICQIEPYATE